MEEPRTVAAEPVVRHRNRLGECPRWDVRTGTLWWVDITASSIHRLDPTTGRHEEIATSLPVTALSPRRAGGFVAAVTEGFAFLADDGRVEVIAPVEAEVAETRMNDGTCDPAGAFWAGTMDKTFTEPRGALYRLGPDLEVTRVLDGVIVSNGIDWSPDGATLYYSDSATRVVRRFPFDPEQPNRLGVPETLAAFTAGFPDGLTVDADGGIWVAEWSGGRVVRLLPEGMIEAEVRLPVSRVTSCAFGGPGLRTLFVTTASSGEDHPEAGMLFACEPGGAGMPPREFAG